MKCEICGKEILRDSQCINYKYYHNNCIENLQEENEQLKIQISAREEVCDRLESNWNKLKKDLELVVDYGLGDESSKWDKIYGEYAKSTLKFMQELEQGSDSNV